MQGDCLLGNYLKDAEFYQFTLEEQNLLSNKEQMPHSHDHHHHSLTIHIVVIPSITKEQIIELKLQARKIINQFNIQHATLEIEQEGEVCHLKEC